MSQKIPISRDLIIEIDNELSAWIKGNPPLAEISLTDLRKRLRSQVVQYQQLRKRLRAEFEQYHPGEDADTDQSIEEIFSDQADDQREAGGVPASESEG